MLFWPWTRIHGGFMWVCFYSNVPFLMWVKCPGRYSFGLFFGFFLWLYTEIRRQMHKRSHWCSSIYYLTIKLTSKRPTGVEEAGGRPNQMSWMRLRTSVGVEWRSWSQNIFKNLQHTLEKAGMWEHKVPGWRNKRTTLVLNASQRRGLLWNRWNWFTRAEKARGEMKNKINDVTH